nr:alpha-amylase family glycosyl hydrolase [Crateriforma conspicua]
MTDPMTCGQFDSILADIYGSVPTELSEALQLLVESANAKPRDESLWDQNDVVCITYADQIRQPGLHPLEAFRRFFLDWELDQKLRCIHLLPFCPYTSDDGFSVVDYLAVDPESGDWDDIARLGQHFDLMFDLVANHTSVSHRWFQGFLADEEPFRNAYIDQDPTADLSAVVRPRSLPLLTPFETASGTKHVWTTFSADQVDLNYGDPATLLRMIETLVLYAQRGARIIRLDAIAFLWKKVGTSCIHLPQTHAIVRLMRAVLDAAVPGTIVLTETNVPHKENISYFGDGTDEAHMVYQFSLPPLLLDAIHSGDTTVLRDWMKSLRPPTNQTTFFNFTASHDGVGVRPLEGLVPRERLDHLVDVVRRHGGRVNMRSQSDGTESPYELNITYLDAVADRSTIEPAEHSRRFLATQAIMLSMQGVPAVYFHSLFGSPNDVAAADESGQNRRINRHKYERDELENALADAAGLQRRVFDGYCRLLELRRQQTAFHPIAAQQVLDLPGDGLLGFVREASDQRIVVLANLSDSAREVSCDQIPIATDYDLLADQSLASGDAISLRPFQVRWLVAVS